MVDIRPAYRVRSSLTTIVGKLLMRTTQNAMPRWMRRIQVSVWCDLCGRNACPSGVRTGYSFRRDNTATDRQVIRDTRQAGRSA